MTVATASAAEPRTGIAPMSEPAYRYHLLRAATERFGRGVARLDAAERELAEAQAVRTLALESRVLDAAEARDVLIPAVQVEQALAAVAARYADADEFDADLAANGLDAAGLRLALRRELLFDAVMQRVGARHAPVTETDERLFFELHRERFGTPERRTARHILITINDAYAENRRDAARARLEAIADQIAAARDDEHRAQRFIRAARRHSECPTAIDGGRLGTQPRGQLYAAVDTVLFALAAGEVSALVESPLGFHLLLCERIEPAATVPFPKARDRIRQAIERRRRRDCQREWLATLPR